MPKMPYIVQKRFKCDNPFIKSIIKKETIFITIIKIEMMIVHEKANNIISSYFEQRPAKVL